MEVHKWTASIMRCEFTENVELSISRRKLVHACYGIHFRDASVEIEEKKEELEPEDSNEKKSKRKRRSTKLFQHTTTKKMYFNFQTWF